MSDNIYKHLFAKHLTNRFAKKDLELTLQDTRDNLEEFIFMLSKDTDMGCFDVLSVTRTDSPSNYTQSFKHPRVTTQNVRVAYEECADIIPLPQRARG